MASIFSRIVSGEIPSYKVAESDRYYAFLDIQPLAAGHTLVVPKIEVDYIFDLDESSYLEFFLFAKRVAEAVKSVVPCKRVGIAVIGLEVPHAHIHLVPLNTMDDINFSREKLHPAVAQFQELSGKIAQAFQGLPA